MRSPNNDYRGWMCCYQYPDGTQCEGTKYTPSGMCVEHAIRCDSCGFIWPNCECDAPPTEYGARPQTADEAQ